MARRLLPRLPEQRSAAGPERRGGRQAALARATQRVGEIGERLLAVRWRGQDEAIHDISFHTSQADAQSGANPIADPSAYQNEEAGVQEIWVRIINNTTVNGCAGVTSFTLYVEELPEPVLTPGNLCRDFNTGVLLSGYLLDSQLDNDTHTFEWFFNGVAIPGATESTYLAEQVGSYSVRATSNLGGCVSEISTPVTVGLSSPASPIGRGYTVSNAFSQSQTITVTVAGHGEYQYSLDGGPWQAGNVFYDVPLGVSQSGEHLVEVRDVLGNCGPAASGSAFLIGYVVAHPGIDYTQWHGLFSNNAMRIFSLLALVALGAHAWVGMWTIATDYLTPMALGKSATAVRFLFQAVCGVAMFAYFVWGVQILWGI